MDGHKRTCACVYLESCSNLTDMGGAEMQLVILKPHSPKMMPIKGLSEEEAKLHRRPLPGKGGHYLSAALLCIWDNIHGPKVLSVWTRDEQTQAHHPTGEKGTIYILYYLCNTPQIPYVCTYLMCVCI